MLSCIVISQPEIPETLPQREERREGRGREGKGREKKKKGGKGKGRGEKHSLLPSLMGAKIQEKCAEEKEHRRQVQFPVRALGGPPGPEYVLDI